MRFKRHQRKEDVARAYFKAAEREGRFGVVLIGVAQEKAQAWKGWRDGGSDAHPHFEFGRQAVFVNHYYFYIRDREWGPSFLKDQRVRPFARCGCGWAAMSGPSARRSPREWTRAARQRLSLVRRHRSAGRDL